MTLADVSTLVKIIINPDCISMIYCYAIFFQEPRQHGDDERKSSCGCFSQATVSGWDQTRAQPASSSLALVTSPHGWQGHRGPQRETAEKTWLQPLGKKPKSLIFACILLQTSLQILGTRWLKAKWFRQLLVVSAYLHPYSRVVDILSCVFTTIVSGLVDLVSIKLPLVFSARAPS